MYALLNDRVAACSQRLACLVPAWLNLRLRLRRVRSGATVRGHDALAADVYTPILSCFLLYAAVAEDGVREECRRTT
jgi:hypothetical protein